jgi:hypothetical protein
VDLENLDDGAASRIHASPVVAALVGAELLARLRGEACRLYNCCACGRPGLSDAEPTTVIVERYARGSVRVRLAHAGCADSQIVECSADAPDLASLGRVLSKSAVLEYASDPPFRPLLIVEPRIGLSERTAGGERVNLVMSCLLDQGFTMLRTGGEFPCPAEGWLLRLAANSARLLTPAGIVAYEGGITQPGSWRELVHRAAACVVLIGAIGLSSYPGDELTTLDLRRLLNHAARAGELAGAVVAVETA